MLIVVEGLDGAGKSTQVGRLRDFLEKNVRRLEYIHFPRYDSPVYGDLISRFLRGDFGTNDSVHPNLVALLFAEDRHGAAPVIRKALDEGATVLLDRYVYSNIAYQCAKLKDERERGNLRDWIINTEYGVFGLPVPDLDIFLDVPLTFVEKNLASARAGDDGRDYLSGGRDIHEADINFQKEVCRIYRNECAADSAFIRIDCAGNDGDMLPADVIFRSLKEIVERKLG